MASLPVLPNLQPMCLEDMKKQLKKNLTVQDLEMAFCSFCRNSECSQAKWATSAWDARIMTQEDRLLINPNISDLSSGKHQEINGWGFHSLLQKAMRLEISDQRGDWEPVHFSTEPEEGYESADGSPEVSDASTDAVEAALAALRGSKPPPKVHKLGPGFEDPLAGVSPPERTDPLERPVRAPEPPPVSPAPLSPVEVPEAPQAPEEPVVEISAPNIEGMVSFLQAMGGVERVVYEGGQLRVHHGPSLDPSTMPSKLGEVEVVYQASAPVLTTSYNTYVPAEGVMVDGSAPPPPSAPPPSQPDPWSVPTDRVIKPGAVVKMGSSND